MQFVFGKTCRLCFQHKLRVETDLKYSRGKMLGVGCHNYKEIEKDMIRAGSSLVIADFLSDKVNSLYV